MLSHPQGHKKTDGSLKEKGNKCALPVANECNTVTLDVNKPAGVKAHFIRALFCVAAICGVHAVYSHRSDLMSSFTDMKLNKQFCEDIYCISITLTITISVPNEAQRVDAAQSF